MIGLAEIESAATALAPVLRRTPLLTSYTLSSLVGFDVLLKAENLQRTGSFKLRGAFNHLRGLDELTRRRGVVAASAGNHAQGVALAAGLLDAPATIVMPDDTPMMKVRRTRDYGADVVLVPGDLEAAMTRARELEAERQLHFVPPYDDWDVIAGQGTVALEILEEAPDVDLILVPCGGGGLLAGITLAAKAVNPEVRVLGVQAAGCDAAVASRKEGRRVRLATSRTFAEGIRVRQIGARPWEVIEAKTDGIVSVSDDATAEAIVTLLEKSKLVIEAAGAVGAAALMEPELGLQGRKVCVVLTGGNVDTNVLHRVIERGLVAAGRHVMLTVEMSDKVGGLASVMATIASQGLHVLDVFHDRKGWAVPMGEVEVSLLLETRHEGQGEELLRLMKQQGFTARLLGPSQNRRHAPPVVDRQPGCARN